MSKGPQKYIIYDSDTPVAAALKRICNRKNMSQFELAISLKSNLKKVYKMINNKAFPDYNEIVLLIKNFGVTASDLFGPELALKLHDNTEKKLASKTQPSVGQTPEKYVSVTLACNKKPVVTKTEPPKPEPVPEQVSEPVSEPVKKKRCDARREGFTSKLAMLFSAKN